MNSTTGRDCGPPNPHSICFGCLASRCFAIGRRRCTSMLIHPRTGETVLWVPYARKPKARLGVVSAEANGRWLFNWAGREWNVADDIEGTAACVVQIVTGP